MKLRSKLILGFLVLTTMLFVAGAISIWEMKNLGLTVQRFLDENYKSVTASKDMIEAVERIDSGVLLILTGAEDDGRNEVQAGDSAFSAALNFARSNITEQGEETLIDTIQFQFYRYQILLDYMLNLNRDTSGINYYQNAIRPEFDDLKYTIKCLMTLNDRAMYNTSVSLHKRIQRSITPGIIAIIAAIVFSILWIYFLNKFFLSPLIQINKALKGNLQFGTPYKVNIETGDELEQLNHSLESILEK